MARFETAANIINRAAVEVGLSKSTSPVGDPDELYQQLVELLNSAGQEMVELHPWQALVSQYRVITSDTDSGEYALPADFSYMIDQTGWEHTNRTQVAGPLTAQDWTYLAGRDLVSSSIYVSFRLQDGKFTVYPNNPVPDALDINFEYINRNWLEEAVTSTPTDTISNDADIVLYEPILIVKFLKVKFLESKGFDATSARTEFQNMFDSRTGKDTGAKLLNAGKAGRGYPYLHPYANTPDTGYGGN
jgi:hypothetical protein